MGSASRALLLAAVAAFAAHARAQSSPSKDERVVPPSFPWTVEPLDALYGHLTEGGFQEPIGVWFEPKGRELYVADSRNGLIGIFDDERIPVFAFGGAAQLVEPKAVVATEDGAIYVLDAQQFELRAFTYRGEPKPVLRFARPPLVVKASKEGSPSDAPAKAAKPVGALLRIGAFARDAKGRWIVGDLDEGRVLVYDAELRFQHELEASARAKRFQTPADIAVSSAGLVAVADMQTTPAIHVYAADGKLLAAFGERDIGLMNFTAPIAVTFDEQGFLYCVDLLRHDVKVFTSKGDFVHHFGGWSTPETRGHAPGEMLYPTDIAIDPKGAIYVAERFGQRVQAFVRKPKVEPEKPSAPTPDAPK
ncbi:MAG: hypothetical protein HZA53_04530 [Planctomycetes bacterium]|nr:hypothetical protein [Planctomycetota bacterium]